MPLDNPAGSRFEQRLRAGLQGEVLFDAFSRGRYSTDASIYQIEPLGVVVPKNREDAATLRWVSGVTVRLIGEGALR